MRRKYKYFVFYEYKKDINNISYRTLFDSCELILDFKIKSYSDVMRAGIRLLGNVDCKEEKRTGIKILNYIKLK